MYIYKWYRDLQEFVELLNDWTDENAFAAFWVGFECREGIHTFNIKRQDGYHLLEDGENIEYDYIDIGTIETDFSDWIHINVNIPFNRCGPENRIKIEQNLGEDFIKDTDDEEDLKLLRSIQRGLINAFKHGDFELLEKIGIKKESYTEYRGLPQCYNNITREDVLSGKWIWSKNYEEVFKDRTKPRTCAVCHKSIKDKAVFIHSFPDNLYAHQDKCIDEYMENTYGKGNWIRLKPRFGVNKQKLDNHDIEDNYLVADDNYGLTEAGIYDYEIFTD